MYVYVYNIFFLYANIINNIFIGNRHRNLVTYVEQGKSGMTKCLFFQLHTVTCIQQSRQRKPNVKTLGSPRSATRYPLSVELLRYCVLSVGTQIRALPCYHSEDMKILININHSPLRGSNPQPSRVQSHVCPTAPGRPQHNLI